MNNISFSMGNGANSTAISNRFIDNFMPDANGAYVKVYIYMLRCLSDSSSNVSLGYIADKLGETEGDVIRALNYWDSKNVISLKRDICNRITDISLLDLDRRTPSDSSSDSSYSADSPVMISSQPASAACSDTVQEDDFYVEEISAHSSAPQAKPIYSDSQISQLIGIADVKWLLQAVEPRVQRLLKPNDVQLILYLYEGLGFDTDLILYLYDFCISRNKRSNSYIEAVAVSWAEDGITTVKQAEQRSLAHNNNYAAVCNAFGLNRAPATIEQQYINRWSITFGFSTDMIVEACNRTMLTISKPDFKYTDRIIENWYRKGAKTVADVAKLNEEFNRNNTVSLKANAARQYNNTKFNFFPQRKYTDEDYSTMEQRLLSK